MLVLGDFWNLVTLMAKKKISKNAFVSLKDLKKNAEAT
jgi:hypothetical protein